MRTRNALIVVILLITGTLSVGCENTLSPKQYLGEVTPLFDGSEWQYQHVHKRHIALLGIDTTVDTQFIRNKVTGEIKVLQANTNGGYSVLSLAAAGVSDVAAAAVFGISMPRAKISSTSGAASTSSGIGTATSN